MRKLLAANGKLPAGVMALLVLLLPVLAEASPREALTPGPSARVVEVVDGDTVRLEDGSQVRLVGLQAPKLPLGRRNFPTWPLAEESKRALEEMVQGRIVELRHGGAPKDRHGRHLAHLFREDGLWVQGEMLRQGMARVYTFPDNRSVVPEMLAREAEARAARRGIWGHDFYAVRSPDGLDGLIDSYQLVEGRVVEATRVGNQVFLNFSKDWRGEFSLRLDRAALALFRQAGIDPLALQGREIRVRGWLKSHNGPRIEVSHPEQIEILS
ncbi:thermonuclease family protein [Telmatospirillum sp. J64-1]|uniref:thermonuclease family protein n=1 Tax=Telmatospirillum sp. J64-1 TaxID=2502183 RepID=UPI002103C610|nr:thermonuclease family protein [Telmatospirillum sp. J64-1]